MPEPATLPAYDLVIGPGSLEGGVPLSAHWFEPKKALIPAETEYHLGMWVWFAPDFIVSDFCPVINMHVTGDEPAYYGINPSPEQIDVSNDRLKWLGHGAGVWNPVDKKFHDVIQGQLPPAGQQPALIKGAWQKWYLHSKIGAQDGFVHFEVNDQVIIDAPRASTDYTGLPHLETWPGFYTKMSDPEPNANTGRTWHMKLTLPQISLVSKADMLQDVPELGAQWGALEHDTSVVTPFTFTIPGAAPPPPPVDRYAAARPYVEKFRAKSPNIAAAFDETWKANP